jgi:HEAT repeat protein
MHWTGVSFIRVASASVLFLTGALTIAVAQKSTDVETPEHKAWDILQNAATSKKTQERADGVRALGLLRENTRARATAEDSLKDPKPEVRASAATALGQMHATESIPKLQDALSDQKIAVVMAAANALRELKDNASAYEVYYDLLMGERKSGDGLVARQLQTLKDPKQLATIGVSEGVGFIPFAGIGWDAWRTMRKKDPNPVRAVAASYLAHDSDPATGKALVKATNDKNWIVRAAAIEAIAQRGDPALLPQVELKFDDRHPKVRYTAAAAVLRLSTIQHDRKTENAKASR